MANHPIIYLFNMTGHSCNYDMQNNL